MKNSKKLLLNLQDELMDNMLEKCKQSQPVIQMIIESTNDDEGILFEALNLNDELQQVISKFEQLEAGSKSGRQLTEHSDTTEANISAPVETQNESRIASAPSIPDEMKTNPSPSTHNETEASASVKGDATESSSNNDQKRMNMN